MSLELGSKLQAARSAADALRVYQDGFHRLVKEGLYRPYVWPYCALGPNLLFLYLLLPPTKSKLVFYLRYPLFLAISYLSIEAMLNCKSSWATYGYCIGIMNSWAIMWTATLLIFRDARSGVRRIEGRVSSDRAVNGNKAVEPSSIIASGATFLNDEQLERRSRPDRTEQKPPTNDSPMPKLDLWHPKTEHPDGYVWQSLPRTFLHRVDWVLDVGCSFRGPRWNFQISEVPVLSHVQSSVKDTALPSPVPKSQTTREDLLRQTLPQFLIIIIVQDVMKNLVMEDPFFWGLGSNVPSPFPWPRLTRTLLSVIYVYSSLQALFLLSPLIGGVLLGSRRIGEHGWPWLYQPFFGPLNNVSQRGLAGAWGQWWHQIFRLAFEETGEIVGLLVGWKKETKRGVLLRVGVAFFCSGLLHACASYTSIFPSSPLNAFTFFAIQPIGIVAQRSLSIWLRKNGWRDRIPVGLRQLGNILAVVLWFHITGPLIADDFAASGVWLYEPLPISPIRGLKGQGYWRWGGSWLKWHADEKWWRSGILL